MGSRFLFGPSHVPDSGKEDLFSQSDPSSQFTLGYPYFSTKRSISWKPFIPGQTEAVGHAKPLPFFCRKGVLQNPVPLPTSFSLLERHGQPSLVPGGVGEEGPGGPRSGLFCKGISISGCCLGSEAFYRETFQQSLQLTCLPLLHSQQLGHPCFT